MPKRGIPKTVKKEITSNWWETNTFCLGTNQTWEIFAINYLPRAVVTKEEKQARL